MIHGQAVKILLSVRPVIHRKLNDVVMVKLRRRLGLPGSLILSICARGRDRRMLGVRWSPDGKSIATVGNHQTITTWDASRAYERERP